MLVFPAVIDLADFETDPLIVANGIAKWKAGWAGDLDTLSGFIQDLGTGTGGTEIRIYNETRSVSMLTTNGTFDVAAATGLLQGFVVDRANSKFSKDDIIRLDIRDVPSGATSAIISVKFHHMALPDAV